MRSIKDVAELAGVSYTTVSHVMNGTRRVSALSREKVLRAVAECGYVPSQAARSLRGAPSRVLGILVPDISDPFCAEVTQGVERAATRAGYSVVLVNTHPSIHPDRLPGGLLGWRVDGLLVVAGLFERDQLFQWLDQFLKKRPLPLVFVDHEPILFRVDVLTSDAQAVARTAVEHLLGLGHRRVACVRGPAGMPVSDARVQGWRDALRAAGIEAQQNWLVMGDFGVVSGFDAAQTLLGQGGPGPSAVFACNDLMAIGVLRAAAQLGVLIPQQCSVVGVDGIVLGEYVQPALTTVGESLPELGARAAALLLQRIADKGQSPPKRLLRVPSLIRRESSGPCPPL